MRFFISLSVIFLISNQTNAIWPFTSSERSSTVPEVTPKPVSPIIQGQSFFDGYDFRHAPSGFFEFPTHFTTFLKPVSYQQQNQKQQTEQQQQEDEQVQQVDPPVNDNGTNGGNKNPLPPVKGSFFNKFWRYRKPALVKPDVFKPETADSHNVASASGLASAPGGVHGIPVVSETIVDSSQEPFGNSGILDPASDPKNGNKATPWNWIFWNHQAQPQQTVDVAAVPVAGVTQPAEIASSEHQINAVSPNNPKRQSFTLPSFPSFTSFPPFNLFPYRKPTSVVAPQAVPSGEHCQCWNAKPGAQHIRPQFGFPLPLPSGIIAPGVVSTDAFPTAVFDNSQQNSHHSSGVQSQGAQIHESQDSQIPAISAQQEGNVKVVVSSPDHQFLDLDSIPNKVIFPVSTSEGSSMSEPIAAESVPEPSSVVPAPPTLLNSDSTNVVVDSTNTSTSGSSNTPGKAMTFSGTVPGGSTTPQEMKGKQFSIGKSKFTASVAPKNAKKP